MATKVGTLYAQLKIDAQQFTAGISGARAELGQFAKAGIGIGAGLGVWNLFGNAVHDVTGFLEDSVKAAIDEQAGIARLTASLNANVPGWSRYNDAIQEAIKSNIQLGFSDDQTRESLAKLVPVTHDVSKALAIQQTAMDLARFKGVDLVEATAALVNIEAGRARGLAQLGINVKDFSTIEERLAAVQRVAGGQAAAYADTTAGKMAKAAASIHDLQEEIGGALVPALGELADGLADGIAGLEGLSRAADDTLRPIGGLASLSDGLFRALFPAAAAAQDLKNKLKAEADAARSAGDGERELAKNLLAHELATLGATDATSDLADAEKRAGDMAASRASRLHEFALKLMEVRRDVQGARDALDDLAKNILDKEYGPRIAAGRIEELRAQIRDLTKEQGTYRKHSSDWVIVTGRIADAQEQLDELLGTQAKAAGDKAYVKWLQDQIAKMTAAGLNTDAYRRKLAALLAEMKAVTSYASQYGGGVTTIGSVGMRQRGGPVWPGASFLVGERGPELFVPKGPGTIVPLPGLSNAGEFSSAYSPSWKGGGMYWIVLNVNPPIGMSPGASREFAAQVGPSVGRWMQEQGILPRRGSPQHG